ncbi:MAG: hypothetical protein QNJ38_24810 [Prochloraceae cyanobacterium]|nr:hypothetical protein [Prochloraceae cyanobacterium]
MKDFLTNIPIDKIKSTLSDRISQIDPNKINNVTGFYKIIEIFSQLPAEQQEELIAIAEFLVEQKDLDRRDKQEWEEWKEVRKTYRKLLIEIKNNQI